MTERHTQGDTRRDGRREAAFAAANRIAAWSALACSLLLSACAGVPPSGDQAGTAAAGSGSTDGAPDLTRASRDCLVFMDALDRVVHLAGVSDGGEHRVPGFPYLRVDRFTASFAERAAAGGADYRAWVERMQAIDARARTYEIANLPEQVFPVLRTLNREQVLAQAQTCGPLLVTQHALQPPQRRRLPELAVVPDDYITSRRVLGLYALAGMPVAAGERSWQRHTRESFGARRKGPPPDDAARYRYIPREPPLPAAQALAQARAVMSASPVDVLGVPQIDEASRQRLLEAFAPSFEIVTHADYDRFGPLQWIDLDGLVASRADRYWLEVEPSQPVVYQQLAFTRYGSAVLPQLVYTIWFSERPMQESDDLLAGRLDGLVWRVTLDEQGAPLIYDAIQPSGRFAMFFPTSRLRAKPAPETETLVEWAFSPIDEPLERWLGAGEDFAAVSLRIESHTHQLVGVGLPEEAWGEPPFATAPYRIADYNRLRMLPLPGSGSRSVFDPAGLVPNTERSGRFVLWSTGIASPGSMRQWGRQPTAFIGRRHFDDPDLFEKRFERVQERVQEAAK